MDLSLSKPWEIVKDREAWHAVVHKSQRAGHDLATEQQKNCCWKVMSTSFDLYLLNECRTCSNILQLRNLKNTLYLLHSLPHVLLYFSTPLKSKSHICFHFTGTIFLSHLLYNVIILNLHSYHFLVSLHCRFKQIHLISIVNKSIILH